MFESLKSLFRFRAMSEEEYRQAKQRILRDAPVPLFWLFGKTGSGKTSLIKYLTGAEEAAIGTGFKPQTTRSRLYDFPSADQPVLRFLDTRGLAEGEYDPEEDLRRFNEEAHLVFVTVRVMDHALEALVKPLEAIRRAAPHRPVILVLTCLHEAYPGEQHPRPDPFDEQGEAGHLPGELRRSLELQKQRFGGLVDYVVPVDLTKPEEGYDRADFGGERLKAATLDALPDAYRQTFLNLDAAMRPLKSLNEQRATPYVISYSTLAATAAAVPTPWIDIPVVLALQSHLIFRLQTVYGQRADTAILRRLTAISGGRLLGSLVIRSTLKLVPYVGIAANAALAYASTYALGKACCWYFGEVQAGNAPSEDEVRRVWQKQFDIASALWRRGRGDSAADNGRAPSDADPARRLEAAEETRRPAEENRS